MNRIILNFGNQEFHNLNTIFKGNLVMGKEEG